MELACCRSGHFYFLLKCDGVEWSGPKWSSTDAGSVSRLKFPINSCSAEWLKRHRSKLKFYGQKWLRRRSWWLHITLKSWFWQVFLRCCRFLQLGCLMSDRRRGTWYAYFRRLKFIFYISTCASWRTTSLLRRALKIASGLAHSATLTTERTEIARFALLMHI